MTLREAMPMTAIHRTDDDVLLTEVQAAEYLALSVRTLQAWRVRGGSPPYQKIGRAVRYSRRALIAWADAHTVTSTTEADAR
jgi:excisionase family DNA binding protein